MDWTAILEAAISFFLVVTALALAYMLLKVGGTFSRMNMFLRRLDEEVIPLLTKLQVTLDEVNSNLEKADDMMGSLVDVTDSVESTTRAVQIAVATPVKKAAGLSSGVSQALATLFNQRGRG
jgi:uncharacterized protein YoxC